MEKKKKVQMSFLGHYVCCDLKGCNMENWSIAVAEYTHCFNTVNAMFPGTETVLTENSIGGIWNLTYRKQCLQAGSKSYCGGCCSNKQ